jgi:hypothetical protein
MQGLRSSPLIKKFTQLMFLKKKLLAIFFTSLSLNLVSQTKTLTLGTIESNFVYDILDSTNPNIVLTHFEKRNNIWRAIELFEIKNKQINFKISYDNRVYGSIKTQFDTTIDRFAYYINCYKILSKNIPTIGEKSLLYSGFIREEVYRPLVVSSGSHFLQRNTFKNRKSEKFDSVLIYNYLKSQAKNLKLGLLPDSIESIIGKMYDVTILDKGIFLITADVKLNMYCYEDRVSFAQDTLNQWNSTEKNFISSSHVTYKACFLISKEKVTYLDYDLMMLDHGDFDNDGFDEIIFKFEKYNKDGYLLITDKLTKKLKTHWSYH